MDDAAQDKPASTAGPRRRWLLALDLSSKAVGKAGARTAGTSRRSSSPSPYLAT